MSIEIEKENVSMLYWPVLACHSLDSRRKVSKPVLGES